MRHRSTVFLLAALLGLSQCQKSAPDPVSQLPPATQTGANTFGCLVNGQPWTPQGYNGTSNYSISYDSGLNGGVFDLQTYRYPDASKYFQNIYIDILSDFQVGTYSFRSPKRVGVVFQDRKTNCYWSNTDSTTTYRRGTLTIMRLDKQAGIISGTFAFTLFKPGCDSVRVTQGRFDKKL
ncbi:DUF6252 family protein [Hymenobacter sp. H14-R3]|uniref:DUF6252 family protein n=1 Tax=Hymenobacter sp. H14-R3 TaxID=3046308 RepID=UPI0024B8C5C3|nr:DUF6252 family protein [Hymenobacter sp. H14-R3]MDJ0365660.1 DUF6252 family protein [Hymenobacter sp. H14-R3]